MRRYFAPLAIIIIGSLLMYCVRVYTFFAYKDILSSILTSFILFLFGVYLNGYKSRKADSWVKKFFVMALYIAFLLIDLNVINFDIITNILSRIGANNVIFYMFYIYFGYIFF